MILLFALLNALISALNEYFYLNLKKRFYENAWFIIYMLVL